MIDSLLQLDYHFFDLINQSLSNAVFDTLMPIIRNKKTWIPFYFILIFFIFKNFKAKTAIIIIVLGVLGVVFADIISSHLLKPYFHRIRPCDLEPFAQHINLVLARCSGAFSFPSSHAANHFALGSFLALVFYKKLKWLSYLLLFWASLICFAQVYVGVHFPIDVMGGAILGFLIALVLYINFVYFTHNG